MAARGATIQRTPKAAALSDEEVAALASIGAGLPVLPTDPDEQIAMTEAELAILEAKGATVAISDNEGHFEVENPDADYGETLFKIGQGDAQFTGKLTHISGSRESVLLWHPLHGRPVALRRAHLMYYIAKGWLARPPGFDPVLGKLPCTSVWAPCKKKFLTPADVQGHLERAHSTEHKSIKVEQGIARDRRMDSLLDAIAKGNTDGGNIGQAQLAAVIMELTDTIKAAQSEPALALEEVPTTEAPPEAQQEPPPAA